MEEIIALLGLTFLWAYLYSKAPESSTVSGFAFRLLFLGMCLWTAHLLVWTLFSTNTTIQVYKYDSLGNFIGSEIHNSTLANPIKQSVLGYLDVLTWVTYGIMALIIIFFIYNSFSLMRTRE
jgi:tellurite resistance protein TehA-like permease